MKILVFIIVAMVALTPFGLITCLAEPTHPNEIGLYTSPDGYGATGTYEVSTPVEVFLVLTKPENPETGEPVSTLIAFECMLTFSPVGSIYLLQEIFPGEGFNIYGNDTIDEGYLAYSYAGSHSWPVLDESIVLITMTFYVVTSQAIEVSLEPAPFQSIPGQMCFFTYEFWPSYLVAMHSVSGSFDAPVFVFNGEAVPVEPESFGSVKSLYR